MDEDEGENWTPRQHPARHGRGSGTDRAARGAPRTCWCACSTRNAARLRRAAGEFGCTCSADRVRQSLSIYSAKDIGHMTTEDGIVTADCQFCGAHYEFDPETLGFEAEVPARRRDGQGIDLDRRWRRGDGGPAPALVGLRPEPAMSSCPPGRKLRPAAVLIAVLRRGRVLTKRASHLTHHPGQIAFPGGKVDPGDADPRRRAARGARGDRPRSRNVAVWRICRPMRRSRATRSRRSWPSSTRGSTPCPRGRGGRGVPCAAGFPDAPANYAIESRRWRGQRRRYYFVAPYGPYYIWGATARMLKSLADRVRDEALIAMRWLTIPHPRGAGRA
jgi:hypothetical protein